MSYSTKPIMCPIVYSWYQNHIIARAKRVRYEMWWEIQINRKSRTFRMLFSISIRHLRQAQISRPGPAWPLGNPPLDMRFEPHYFTHLASAYRIRKYGLMQHWFLSMRTGYQHWCVVCSTFHNRTRWARAVREVATVHPRVIYILK